MCIYVCGERSKNKVTALREFIIYKDRYEDVTQTHAIAGRKKSHLIWGNLRQLPGGSTTSWKGNQKKEKKFGKGEVSQQYQMLPRD